MHDFGSITQYVSIHASHAGGDGAQGNFQHSDRLFQSTPPMREATQRRLDPLLVRRVSIHASHAGGDARGNTKDQGEVAVSIHASHAGGDFMAA